MRRPLFLLLAIALAASSVRAGEPAPDDTCLRIGGAGELDGDLSLRCRRHGAGGAAPPHLFARGCYYGNGTQARLIQTGVPADQAGVLFVNKVSTSEAFCNRWLSPTLVTASIQGRGQANCTNNEGTALFAGFSQNGFVVNDNATDNAAGDSLNENLEAYCWYAWNTAPLWHGTFTYTGNGSSPRTIDLPGAGDLTGAGVVLIQNRNNGDSPIPANGFVGKTADMSATQSMIWAHSSAGVSDANMIRALGNHTVDVGSHLNENGVAYHGVWWNLSDPDEGGLFDWTGNGTSGGDNCATGADVQSFGLAPCSITGILTMEDYFDEGPVVPAGCAHQECDAIRADNIDINLAGPGNISGSTNYYVQQQAAPDDTGLRLRNGSFDVTGGSTNENSCNDNTSHYFSAFFCGAAPTTSDTPPPTVTQTRTPTVTATPTITSTPSVTATATPTNADTSPANWSGDFIAVWEMDEASSATRASTGTCTTDCALANTGSVTKDTTSGHFAFGTGGAAADSALSDNLSCAASTCDEIKLNAVGGATWGCYGYVPTDGEQGQMLSWTTAATRWNIQRTTANNNVTCQVREAGGTLRSANTALNTWVAADRVFAACTFDDANNELKAYTANTAGTATSTSDIGNTTTGNFQAAGGDSGWTGTVDTCFIEDHELSDTDLCRICSCGINGALGSCLCTGGGTAYTNSGLNASECGSCTLPSCNKAHPD